jgi:hypothetical protein
MNEIVHFEAQGLGDLSAYHAKLTAYLPNLNFLRLDQLLKRY